LIKIQGITHPGADVEINLFRLGVLVQTKLARSTASGNFVITIDAPSQPGSYTFTGYSIDEAGNRSEESAPFTVIVNPVWFDEFVKSILSYASLFVLLALGLIGFIISTLFIWYRSMRIIRSMKQESREADQVLEESFALLHNSVASHIARLQSVDRELTKEEVIFLEQFEKELAGAKNVVSKEIKDISQ